MEHKSHEERLEDKRQDARETVSRALASLDPKGMVQLVEDNEHEYELIAGMLATICCVTALDQKTVGTLAVLAGLGPIAKSLDESKPTKFQVDLIKLQDALHRSRLN